MNQQSQFKTHYPKLRLEAILKSLLCGLSVSFGADFVLGITFWAIGLRNVGLVLGVLAATTVLVTIVTAVVFYSTKFRPTIIANARRIDSLGLEERLVTMVDFQNDNSTMATLQRSDALAALSRVNKDQIKIQIHKKILVALAITATFGLAMSVVAGLSAAGLLPDGGEFIESILPPDPPVYVPVSYMAEDGGYIEGVTEQLVLLGESASPVVAIPEEGYSFEGWDDGYKKPARVDSTIDHPLVLVAIFVPLEEEGDDPNGDGDPSEDGEEGGEEEGDNGEPGDQPGDNGEPSDAPEGTGKYNDYNQIINGETYYREVLEEYKDKIMELLEKNPEELTEEEKAIIEAYINIV